MLPPLPRDNSVDPTGPVWKVCAQLGFCQEPPDRHFPFKTQTLSPQALGWDPNRPFPGRPPLPAPPTDLLRAQAVWHGAQLRGWGLDVRNTDLQEPHVLLLRVTWKGRRAGSDSWRWGPLQSRVLGDEELLRPHGVRASHGTQRHALLEEPVPK